MDAAIQAVLMAHKLVVNVNGAKLVLLPRTKEATGNVLFEGTQEGSLPDPSVAQKALAAMVAEYEGERLSCKSGVVRSKTKQNKAGKVTGGNNLTTYHHIVITVEGIKMLLHVRATVVEKDGKAKVVVDAGTMPLATGGIKVKGELVGELSFTP